MDLQGKVAIITGASSGIGAAVSRDLAGAKMRLLVTARRQDRLEKLTSELPGSAYLASDISDPGLPARLMEKCLDLFGDCHVVVNNAGVMELGPIPDIDIEKICRMVRVNVESAYRLAYTALKHFVSRGTGHLVNISSILGTKTRSTAGAYAGTKYAIEALSEALRLELAGTDVQVSAIEPGLVLTELHDHMPVHPMQTLNVKHPLQPHDVARCVRFVLEQDRHVRIPRLMVLPGENPI